MIGIDEKALETLGAYNTWDRSVMARALEALAADPDRLPAVVAIDTLYAGETDEAADARLAEAAKRLGNVVTASSAVFGSSLAQFSDGVGVSYKINDYAVLQYEEPYDALRQVTAQGHINAMYDTDGVMRHALLYVDVPEDTGADKTGVGKVAAGTSSERNARRVYSMAYEAAALYAKAAGREIAPPPVNARGQFYVSFAALPGGFYDGVSLADLLAGEVPADYYAGKLVFLGPYAAGLQDAYFTPVDKAKQMYGIEFQANVVRQMIDGEYKREAPELLQAAVLFAVCFGAFFLFLQSGIALSSVACAALIALGILGAYLAYAGGWILHPLWLPAGVSVLYVASIGGRYLRSVLGKQRVTRTFERYVAPEIVREILKEGTENLSLGGKTCEIAVLFVDVRGFTTMSERLTPEKVVFILNRYLTMTSDCIERNRGTLDKFVGDAAMAFWGAPLPQDDAVYLAVKTAMEIVEGAERVSKELQEEIGEELHVGVGVHYGPAVVGNMGAQRHMDYTAIGDTVNTAARLEANAPGGTVYISRAVADALGARARTTSLGGSIKLKGKAEGFEVLTLDGLTAQEET